IAATWYELGRLYRATNQSADGEAACKTAVRLWDALATESPGEAKYRAELARSLQSQANLYFLLGRLGPARAATERALAIRDKLATAAPQDATIARDLATTWDNLANLRAVAREWPESTTARRTAADHFRRLVGAYPNRAQYHNDLGRV